MHRHTTPSGPGRRTSVAWTRAGLALVALLIGCGSEPSPAAPPAGGSPRPPALVDTEVAEHGSADDPARGRTADATVLRDPTREAELDLLWYLEHGTTTDLDDVRQLPVVSTYDPVKPVYLPFLVAYAHHLAGDEQAEQATLAPLGDDMVGVYELLFRVDAATMAGNLRCNLLLRCLGDKGQKRDPRPGASGLEFATDPLPARPVRCGDVTQDPTTCPASFLLFERIANPRWVADRLALYSQARPEPVSMETFLEGIGVRPGQTVVDVGAGEGYFTLPLARQVGPDGQVVAVELTGELLRFIGARAERAGLTNVTLVESAPDDIGVAAGSADLVYVCDMLKDVYLEDVVARDQGQPLVSSPFLVSIREALVEGGRLAVVEGRPPPGRTDARTDPDRLRSWIESAGFRFAGEREDFEPRRFVQLYDRPDSDG